VREIEGLGQEMHALFRGSCRIGCWVRVAVSVIDTVICVNSVRSSCWPHNFIDT
jgi:hypothetical protein